MQLFFNFYQLKLINSKKKEKILVKLRLKMRPKWKKIKEVVAQKLVLILLSIKKTEIAMSIKQKKI